MGSFHCPIGSPGYNSMGCVKCGLCIATTKDEAIAATEVIRKYMRETAHLRNRKKEIKKIAVCGKGGAGKSTVTALLAEAMRRYGFSPLVIDTDDSNMGLGRKLDIVNPPAHLLECLERFSMGDSEQDLEWLQKDPLEMEEIPAAFRAENNGISLMVSGKIENPLQGCACTIGELTKQVVMNLSLKQNEVVIVDEDAGIESFGRGVEQGVDTLLIIVEPSFDSVDLAGTMQYMAEGLGIRRIRVIINKAVDEEQDEMIRDMLSDRDIRFLGTLYTSKEVAKNSLCGQALTMTDRMDEMMEIVSLMLDEAEMKYPLEGG